MDNSKYNNDEMSQSVYDSLYRRPANPGSSNKTVLIDSTGNDMTFGADSYSRQETENTPSICKECVVGVLYSVSRNTNGEIFPIHLGENHIGCNTECDICLLEETVSAQHAILNVWEDDCDSTDYQMNISDLGSFFGTRVNAEEVNYGSVAVSDDDIISIGNHYHLLVRLFNAKSHRMCVDPEFMPLIKDDRNSSNEPTGSIDANFYIKNEEDDNGKHTVLYDGNEF